jgi:hypothetical protein
MNSTGLAGTTAEALQDETAAELRAAIHAEDYETAGRLMVQLTEALQSHPGISTPEGSRALAETMSLLLWAKKMVMANRAHLQAKLSQVSQAGRYQSAQGGSRSRTWLMHG